MDYVNAFRFDASQNKLQDFDPSFTGSYSDKKQVKKIFKKSLNRMRELQDMLYAQGKHGILIILQAMDAGGKDGVIKHVMSGVNPQGCKVKSFIAPSGEELRHDYMWRCMKALPGRGMIGIFNRSYYEEVLVVKVHDEILSLQNIPFPDGKSSPGTEFWETRYRDISNFEKYFTNNGFQVIKFFLNVSKEEQKKRFLSRIEKPSKNWKFALADVKERQKWDLYQQAYDAMLQNTSQEYAPWYVIPADKKWFMRTAIGQIIVHHLEQLNLEYPQVGPDHLKIIARGKKELDQE